ncbi:hypothetical protein FHT40_005272 [Mycolicibacterium sp. BK556]|uniref:hypothetical protein n=1 Tax=unclassified Mycolicibacterium TaxID=2636767 RepID=UPI00161C07D8|nr:MULTISPECIES: hypothetical protein [unclassified Mycolicibacterium]MBB3605585.1 hypothetical protein [Mycolicibacterium sp. BK556]MBB3635918.1 hypothetical protein [Mycolicibacterium sp. BK607]MBB3753331.1 hypothetical protein [Mycolicibacterium sp. BK634]
MAGSDGGMTCGFRPVIATFVLIVIASVEQIWGLPMPAPRTEVVGPSRFIGPSTDEPVLTIVELWGVSPNGDNDFGQAAAVAASMGQPLPHASPLMRAVRKLIRPVRAQRLFNWNSRFRAADPGSEGENS